MKTYLIRTASVILLLATILSVLPVFGSTQPTYSTTSNSGIRDVICTTLDGTGADAYYGVDYDYDMLSELSSADLYQELAELMTTTHKKITTYDNCRDYAVRTDCEQGDGRVMLIYTSYSANGMSDYLGGAANWNREHVWPKSLGGFETSKAGSDLHHIRPSNASVNSSRGNDKYGEVNGGSTTSCTIGGKTYVGGYRQSGYFEPLDNVKGDVARICLYLYVRWAAEYPQCKSITNVFQSVDVLLDWCEQDPVDTWEMGRNEVVGSIQGNRNVFIDYPEYAWLLFDREVPDDMITPSGEASDGNAGGTSCAHPSTQIKNNTSATCGKDGYTGDTYCNDCGKKIKSGSTIAATGNHSFGAWITAADGSKSRTCSICKKVETEGVVLPGTSATISFTDVANRVSFSTSQQVWKQNGITVTNDKASATSNVADYHNPGRFYKGSNVTITAPGMTKIVVDCTGLESKYVNSWSNSFNDSNATATVSGSIVTITFKNPVDSFTWTSMSAQGRAYKMTVTTSGGGSVTPPATTPVPPPETTPDTPNTPELPVITAPKAGIAYKFAMVQGNVGKTFYLKGGMNGYYMDTTDNVADAIDVYLEKTDGGYYLYTMVNGVKTYINMVVSADGMHVNGAYEATATTVYKWNAEKNTIVAEVNGADYWFGTRNDKTYTTVGPVKVEYDGFYCRFYGGDTPCTHTNTEIKNAKAATCKDEGYTGDTYCKTCGEKVKTGSKIPTTDKHSFGEWVTNADGSKSRTCSVCQKVETEAAPPVTEPVTPPATEPVTPPATEPVTPPATEPVTPPATEPVTPPVTDPVTPPADCPHTNVEHKNEVAPSCKEGYSGDIYCADCGELVDKGMVYPPVSAHEYGEATVSEDGKLETKICKVCGDKLETALASNQGDLTILWIVIGGVVAAGVLAAVVILIIKKRK